MIHGYNNDYLFLVYTKGYDGHCYRSYYYWKDKMPDIENTLESINSIENKYPEIRQASKEPTFLLTYGGTYHGLYSDLITRLKNSNAALTVNMQ
jgi:hypothetical protein